MHLKQALRRVINMTDLELVVYGAALTIMIIVVYYEQRKRDGK